LCPTEVLPVTLGTVCAQQDGTRKNKGQEIPLILCNLKVLYLFSQRSATCLCPESGESSSHSRMPFLLRSILILSSHHRLGLAICILLSGSHFKTCYKFGTPPPNVPPASPVSPSSTPRPHHFNNSLSVVQLKNVTGM
jgi:hypothetical protein